MPNSFVYEILFVYIIYILFVYNRYLNPLEGRVRVWDHKQQVLKEITDHVDKIKVSESMKKEKGVICECIDVTKKKNVFELKEEKLYVLKNVWSQKEQIESNV